MASCEQTQAQLLAYLYDLLEAEERQAELGAPGQDHEHRYAAYAHAKGSLFDLSVFFSHGRWPDKPARSQWQQDELRRTSMHGGV